MCLAVLAVIAGQALLLGRPVLLLYAAVAARWATGMCSQPRHGGMAHTMTPIGGPYPAGGSACSRRQVFRRPEAD